MMRPLGFFWVGRGQKKNETKEKGRNVRVERWNVCWSSVEFMRAHLGSCSRRQPHVRP